MKQNDLKKLAVENGNFVHLGIILFLLLTKLSHEVSWVHSHNIIL